MNYRKAIIFDCDYTLWDGIIGEGHVDVNTKFQDEIVGYAKAGIIIGICSKNNEADVLSALKTMPLTEEYISVHRINWKDKVSNMKEIAQELNIGLDAIVFVDDSPFERELMKVHLPDVLVIEPEQLSTVIMGYVNPLGGITKTRQYQENRARMKYEEQFTDINDFLASLEMVLKISKNDTSHVARIAEMTQKTNQFNLTSHRMTERDVQGSMVWNTTYTMSVKDKFGDHGITGVCMFSGNNIYNLMLSCRILGKGIEYAFMDYIIEDLKKDNVQQIHGSYIPSEKNGQVELFLPKVGFKYLRTIGLEKIYYLYLKNYTPKAEKHFRYE